MSYTNLSNIIQDHYGNCLFLRSPQSLLDDRVIEHMPIILHCLI